MNTVKAKYYDYWAEGIIGNDVISIKDTSLGKMKFLIVNKSKGFNKIDGMIGLGYTPSRSESKFSFIQQLYAMKIIPHKVFAQKYHNATNGEITFGEIPKYIVEDYTNYGRCKALNKVVSGVKFKNKNWQCGLNALNFADVFRNDKVYRLTNKKVSFLEFRKRTLIPEYVFNYFKGHYFKPYLESKQCSIVKKKKYTTIKCASDVKIDNLNFVLGDKWHTPTEEQMKELFDNTTNEESELNGVKGTLFTSKTNGNTLFFPYSGYKIYSNVYEIHICHYWSSSLSDNLTNRAMASDSDFYDYGLRSCNRFSGLCVRGVLDKK